MTEEEYKRYCLSDLPPGEEGIIEDLVGGRGFRRKLERMGISNGRKIKKIVGYPFRGPVTFKIENIGTYSIGYGMAKKIFVDVYESDQKP